MTTPVPTPVGDARLTHFAATGARRAVLVLGHGAGGGIGAPDLQALAAALPGHGVDVVLVEQPWRVAGKRIASPPKTLDAAWIAVLEYLGRSHEHSHGHERGGGDVPLIVGGRSAGARVACRTGKATGASAVLALAFPLHPPGRPEKSRFEELAGTALPTLVVQGGTDPFGTGEQFPPLPAGQRLVALPAGNHEFSVRKDQAPVIDTIVEAVVDWIDELV